MAKLIHIQNKSTFDSKVDELSPDSIVFIKDTKQIWTHGLLYSCPLSLEEINTLLENKANISDLSNVLAEEVIDEPLLSEINTLTREEIKKDLFIDMWNQACGSYGTYNAETGYFELNGLTDITYDEAIGIYNISKKSVCGIAEKAYSGLNKYSIKKTFRTVLPLKILVHESNLKNCFYSCSELEVVSFIVYGGNLNIHPGDNMFNGCTKLKCILGSFYSAYSTSLQNLFKSCSSLETLDFYSNKNSFEIKDSPNLTLVSVRNFLKKTSDVSITITVHPDVYAKLTGDTTNQAAAALTPEEAIQWQQLVTDAAAKQITFVTV